ncbi:MAG: nuclear transport factor 2 family protein [Dehalococcoidales bacterium]|nr:nuclear transport factor 2 family protein [Dehalococcoidales bacterium]
MDLDEMEQRIKELENQVARLKDLEAIRRLQKAYGYYLEHWMQDEIVDLFADCPDVTLSLFAGIYTGKESIRRYFNGEDPDDNPEFLHQVMQLSDIIDIAEDGQTAEGRWYGFGSVAFPSGKGVRPASFSGVYACEYIKEQGTWKIKKLKWNPIYMVSPSEGWVKAERIAAIDTHQPRKSAQPDKPREMDTRYPSGYIVPFHYKHPVTGKKTTEEKHNKSLLPNAGED